MSGYKGPPPEAYGIFRNTDPERPPLDSMWMSRATAVVWKVTAHSRTHKSRLTLTRPLGKSSQTMDISTRDLFAVDTGGKTLWMACAVAEAAPSAVLPFLRSRNTKHLDQPAQDFLSQLWIPHALR